MELKAKLLLLKQACEICEKTDYVRAIERYIKNFHNPISIMLVGEGKHGKTCLLNGLLGKTVATEGLGIKSANKNYYRNVSGMQYVSENPYDMENGNKFEIKNDEELQHQYEKIRNEKNVNAYWSLNLEWPNEDIIVIDTEGFNQSNAHLSIESSQMNLTTGTQVVYSDLFDDIYSEADIIIWCVKGQYIGSTIEKFKTVKVYNKPIFLVYTFADWDIENEDLEEIETPEDVIADMRFTLGEMAQNCIKDFAGFAGDYKNPKRRESFLLQLRTEIYSYIKNCEKGLKLEVGERLFNGIYQELYANIQLKIKDRYNVLSQYYSLRDELIKRITGILEEYIQRISVILDKLNGSIDHETLYSKAFDECERNYDKSFAAITKYYDDLFAQEMNLHEIIDKLLPEKIRLIEKEFISSPYFIDNGELEEIDLSKLWNLQKEQFLKLRYDAQGWGIFTNWKSDKFRKYFKDLNTNWRNTIQQVFKRMIQRYDIGLKVWVEKNYQADLECYVEQTIYHEWIEQKLRRIQKIETEDVQDKYFVYGLKHENKVACIEGEHTYLYNRFAQNHTNVFATERILFEQYIERDIQKYEQKIECYFNNFNYKNLDEAWAKLDKCTLSEIVLIPKRFEDLQSVKEEIDHLDRAGNFSGDYVQEYYTNRLNILIKYCSNHLNKMRSDIRSKIQKEVVVCVQTYITDALEQQFVRWKNGFWDYIYSYGKEYTVRPVVYYSFENYLEKNQAEIAELYLSNEEKAQTILGKALLEKHMKVKLSAIRERMLLPEIKRVLGKYKQYVELEEKQQQDAICAVNKRICLARMSEYLREAEKLAIKIPYMQIIQVSEYESQYGFMENIKELDTGLTTVEKKLLLDEYKDIKDKLYGDFCKCWIYKEIEYDLKQQYKKEKERILTDCIERIRRVQKNG
ncbi:MAG: hypothetical protein J6A75_03010 [Lachnospiraceae bacterium]|nr:hypothetical protein [Lachnospiraceae bacterium]